LLKSGIAIARSHHEKWDGSGYPDGLAGEQIPLPARIMALADVYDALRSKRPYKPAFTHEKSVRIILEDVARHFDPAILEAFQVVEAEFDGICK
jgi:putative two-component system response regulator